jgi:hypothetical protein
MSLSVTITRDEVTPLLQQLPDTLRGDGMKRAMGRGVATLIKANFATLQSQRPNRRGWPRQGYWAQAARSVQKPQLVSDGIVVSINQPGIAARWFGPTEIKPVAARNLAVPAIADAYGTRPIDAQWKGLLQFKMVGGRHMALVAKQNFMRVVSKGKRAGQRVRAALDKATEGIYEVVFWLRKKVTIPKDATVLPAPEDMKTAAIMAGSEYVSAQLAKGGK